MRIVMAGMVVAGFVAGAVIMAVATSGVTEIAHSVIAATEFTSVLNPR